MIARLIDKNQEVKEMKIFTLVSRLKEVKGDIKIRTEIVREVLHNGIDASASKIDIDIEYNSYKKVDIIITCYGNNLKTFNSVEDIVKSLLEVDISDKKDIDNKIGGKGRGAKTILSAEKLIIKSQSNGKVNAIEIENPNKQVEEMYKDNKDIFLVRVLNNNDSINSCESKTKFTIKGINTNQIEYFEHKPLIQYLKFFTILSGIKNNKSIAENLVVNVRGLVKDNAGISEYITNPNSEKLKVENQFDKLKEFGLSNNCKFSCIKCSDGKIECISNVKKGYENKVLKDKELLKICLEEDEINYLKDFFKYKDKECYIFRTKDTSYSKNLKKEMRLVDNSKGRKSIVKDSDYFGIRAATEGVMIYELLSNLSARRAGDSSGGNIFAQYFGYISDSKISTTGNRNSIEANSEYYETIDNTFSDEIMPLINSVLSFSDKKKNKTPNLIEELEGIDSNIIQGLWTELCFILENSDNISSWAASQKDKKRRKPHDFEFEEYFYEIKSKQTNNDSSQNLIHISSLNQLDDNKLGYLRIYYLQSNVDSSMSGMNILDIIQSVSEKLDDNQQKELFIGIERYLSIKGFKDKYDNLDSSESTSNLERFIAEYYIEYTIDENFPCLRKEKLYKLLNESCAELDITGYDLNLSDVNNKLKIYPKKHMINQKKKK